MSRLSVGPAGSTCDIRVSAHRARQRALPESGNRRFQRVAPLPFPPPLWRPRRLLAAKEGELPRPARGGFGILFPFRSPENYLHRQQTKSSRVLFVGEDY